MITSIDNLNHIPRPDLRVVASNTAEDVAAFAHEPQETHALDDAEANIRPTVFDQDDPKHALIDHQEPEGQTSLARLTSDVNNAAITPNSVKARSAEVLGIPIMESTQQKAAKRIAGFGKYVVLYAADVGKSVLGRREDRTITNPAEGLADLAQKQSDIDLALNGSRKNTGRAVGTYRK